MNRWLPVKPVAVQIPFGCEYVKTNADYPGVERVIELIESKGHCKSIKRRVYFRLASDRAHREYSIQDAVKWGEVWQERNKPDSSGLKKLDL